MALFYDPKLLKHGPVRSPAKNFQKQLKKNPRLL